MIRRFWGIPALLLTTAALAQVSGGPLSGVSVINGATIPASQSCLGSNSTSQLIAGTCGGGSPPFNSVTSGTNTTAAMLVGTGGSLGVTGSGTIAATSLSSLSGLPTQSPGTMLANCTGSEAAPTASTVLCVSGPASTLVSIVGPAGQWIKVGAGLSYTAFSTAATSNSIALFTLPPGGVVHAIKIKQSASFTGGSISGYTISVGIFGSTQLLASAFNVFQAPGGSVLQLSPQFYESSDSSALSVLVTATSTGANLSAATAGSVDIWAYLSVSL